MVSELRETNARQSVVPLSAKDMPTVQVEVTHHGGVFRQISWAEATAAGLGRMDVQVAATQYSIHKLNTTLLTMGLCVEGGLSAATDGQWWQVLK